jgi:hypothetical protein
VAALTALGGAAFADGPSGSTESNNQVSCGGGEATPAGTVYAGANGVETCSDDGSVPDGRIIVSIEDQYISADGDADNPSEIQGWIRLDSNGVTCGGDGDDDSTDGGGGSCM